MNKFSCKNKECVTAYKENDEDINLILHIEEGSYTEYKIKDDGKLEYHDSDGIGQEIHLRCPLCNQEYEFNVDYFEIQEQHVLPFNEKDLEDIDIVKVKW